MIIGIGINNGPPSYTSSSTQTTITSSNTIITTYYLCLIIIYAYAYYHHLLFRPTPPPHQPFMPAAYLSPHLRPCTRLQNYMSFIIILNFNITTTPTHHSIYTNIVMYLVELCLSLESVVHQLKMVHGPKRSG